jgi:hypothetical protein
MTQTLYAHMNKIKFKKKKKTCTCITLKVLSLDLHCALSHVLFGFSLAFLRPMYEVLSQLCFLKPMLKFSVQTFYQPLFSIFP